MEIKIPSGSYIFLIVFILATINSVNSQLNFGNSKESKEDPKGIIILGRGDLDDHQEDGTGVLRQTLQKLGELGEKVGLVTKTAGKVGAAKLGVGKLDPHHHGIGHGHHGLHHQGHGIGHDHGHHGHVQIAPQSVCILKSDPGFCNLIVGRWYYDHRYHRCLPFLYTGCGGNTNNFVTMKKCQAATHQCHYYTNHHLDPLTKQALINPLNPLGGLTSGFVLAG